MKAELVAERTDALPTGPVRLSVARHDDGHYTGVAQLLDSGRRIGLLVAAPPVAGRTTVSDTRVDPAVAGPEVGTALAQFLYEVAATEEARVAAASSGLAADEA